MREIVVMHRFGVPELALQRLVQAIRQQRISILGLYLRTL
jgi:hypothetical protein